MLPKKSDYATVKLFIAKIWKYLTFEWFRLAEKEVDRENKNQSHAVVSDLWRMVQGAFDIPRKAIKRKRGRSNINIPCLVAQAAGCLVSAVAGMGIYKKATESIIVSAGNAIIEKLQEVVTSPGFVEKYVCRQTLGAVSF